MGHPFQIRITLRKIESQITTLTIALTSQYFYARDVIFLEEPLIQWYKLNLNNFRFAKAHLYDFPFICNASLKTKPES